MSRTSRRVTVVLAVALATALSLPALRMGWGDAEAQLQLHALAGRSRSSATRAELWRWQLGRAAEVERLRFQGFLPWTAPDHERYAFWRPLASVTLRLDYWLFKDNATGYHAQSLLWYLLVVILAGILFFRRLSPAVAVLALVFFAVAEHHWRVIGDITCRHYLVATSLALLGLLAHLRYREENWRPGLILSLAAYVAAAFSSEVFLQMLAYVLAYELAGVRDAWPRRLRAVLPAAVLAGAYVLFHETVLKAAGYGVALSGQSATDGWVILPAAAVKLVLGHYGDGLLATPLSSWIFGLVFIIAAALVLRALAATLGDGDARATRWLTLGAALALVPAATAPAPDLRFLFIPSLGAVVWLAMCAERTGRLVATQWPRAWRRALGGVALLAALAGVHAIGAATTRTERLRALGTLDHTLLATYERYQREAGCPVATRDVIAIHVPARAELEKVPLMHPPAAAGPTWWPLSTMAAAHELVRTGPATLDIVLTTRWPQWPVGREARLRALAVRVLAPDRLRVTFDRPIDDASWCFVTWGNTAPRRFSPPAPGASLRLPEWPSDDAPWPWDDIVAFW